MHTHQKKILNELLVLAICECNTAFTAAYNTYLYASVPHTDIFATLVYHVINYNHLVDSQNNPLSPVISLVITAVD